MNNKIKLLTQAVATLLLTHAVGVSAEYYTVKPGDVLSVIAKNKSAKSGFVLSPEQVMLTLYKLNQDAFINGDIDKLIVAKRLNIPDGTEDYIQISKNEALQRIREKELNNLQSLPTTSNTDTQMGNATGDAFGNSGGQEYSQIVKRLNDHQQNIELLKIENAHITKSFKLLERALGRVVLVQGLMTNDLLKVKSRISDKSINGNDGSLGLDSVKLLSDSNVLGDSALPTPVKNNNVNSKADNDAGLVAESLAAEQDKIANESQANPDIVDAPIKQDVNTANSSAIVDGKGNDDWLDWVMAGSILLPLVLALIWALDFRRIRSKRLNAQEEASASPIVKASSSDGSRNTSATKLVKQASEMQESDKLSLDKLVAEHGETVENDSELVSALELLDMCLLFGDYKQARAVALKAVDDYQDSPVLSRKITFIERKLVKA